MNSNTSASLAWLDKLSSKTILIIGDLMLDEYIWGEVSRISPEAPVPVVEMQRRSYIPGGAANAAANVVSLGGRAVLGGVVGADAQASQMRAVLEQHFIQVDGLIEASDRVTTVKTRIIAGHQQIARLDHESRIPLGEQHETKMAAWAVEQMAQVEACILSDYGKGVLTPRLCAIVIQAARQARVPLVVDPKGADYTKYQGADLIKPNLHEVEKVLKYEIADDTSLHDAARQLQTKLPASALLITRGSRGMTLFAPGEAPQDFASQAREVYDVTGAGDTVIGTLALTLAAGLSLKHAVYVANQCAGIVVGKMGTSTVRREELAAALHAAQSPVDV